MFCLFSAVTADDLFKGFAVLPKEEKLIYTSVALAGAITAWGFAFWDYGDQCPYANSEHWFGPNTKKGGVDKPGHACLIYLFTHGLSSLYERWGYQPEKAAMRPFSP